ncbi:hypothetical protein SUGI_0792940 [Cryptomeria japonica]|nr:hypothetical protein SUGI_0792940 [Cryptomeria japonica]
MSFIRSLIILSLLLLAEGSAFVYNGFRSSTLKLGGSARILKSGVLQITNKTQVVLGHAFHSSPIHLNNQSFSFSTTFVFSIRPQVRVFLALSGESKPRRPLLSAAIDLRGVVQDNVYVGFSASTGLLSSAHLILGWSFSTNGSAAELELPNFGTGERGATRVVIIVSSVGFAMVVCLIMLSLFMRRRLARFDQWAECGPRKFTYSELKDATKNFKELLGSGGFGKVYRGVLNDGQEVAVKRVSQDSRQGMREFLAEILTIGRLRHRNLMRLHGYCRQQRKSELLLVYEYMPNASLDKKLFYDGGLSWEQRFTILKGVASALLYLHEEWEQQVIHRDVKASNVLLDGKLNARLGDFGLARLYDHGKNPQTTRAVGTLGYVAPEVMRTGKPTTSSDVYSYGSLLLETVCGRRPVEPRRCEEEMVLVEWVWSFQVRGEILSVADPRLLFASGHSDCMAEEMELVLKLGLLCLHVLPERRPCMRQVVQILNKDVPLPPLPPQMPTIEHPPPPLSFNYCLPKRVDS